MRASLLLCLLCLAPSLALAQNNEARAREAFQAGLDAVRAGQWEQARQHFQSSYDLSPRPTTLINLAGALVQTGRWIEATETYHRFLSQAHTGPAAEHRPAAEEALARLQERLPKVRVRVVDGQVGDRVTLDGRPLLAAALTRDLPLDPGDHVLVLERVGQPPVRMPFRADEGVVREVVLTTTPQIVPSGPSETVTPPVGGGSVFESPWFWIISGIVVAGGVALALGLTFGLQGGPQPYTGNLGRIGLD